MEGQGNKAVYNIRATSRHSAVVKTEVYDAALWIAIFCVRGPRFRYLIKSDAVD